MPDSSAAARRALLIDLLQTFAAAIVIAAILRVYVVESFTVLGPSMEPTLYSYQRLTVVKILYRFHPPERGDVIIFTYPRNPTRDFVKRVIGLPGERVEIRAGTVFVNGSPLSEPYVVHRDSGDMAPVMVKAGTVFLLGDNRRDSEDSRSFGPVSFSLIKGRAMLRYWPPAAIAILK